MIIAVKVDGDYTEKKKPTTLEVKGGKLWGINSPLKLLKGELLI